jgi:hypothetical protein
MFKVWCISYGHWPIVLNNEGNENLFSVIKKNLNSDLNIGFNITDFKIISVNGRYQTEVYDWVSNSERKWVHQYVLKCTPGTTYIQAERRRNLFHYDMVWICLVFEKISKHALPHLNTPNDSWLFSNRTYTLTINTHTYYRTFLIKNNIKFPVR